jgi:hypothetical protein
MSHMQGDNLWHIGSFLSSLSKRSLRSAMNSIVKRPPAERCSGDCSSRASCFALENATYADRVVRHHAVALVALAVEVPGQLLASLGDSEKEVGVPGPP